MLKRTMQTRMLVALFVVTMFASATLSTLGQKASPVAPNKAQVEVVVREAYEKFKSDTSGKNADYIPFLAQVDSKMFGVAVVSTDNQVFSIGEINYAFSIQSISKVYTLALAMEELGANRVFERIGSELIWGRRENFLDGFSSEDVHLQFSFKYNFSKEFKF